MGRAGCEFVDVDAVIDDRGVASGKPIPGDVEFVNSFRNEDQGINPAHGVAPDPFAVGIPVAISAVTSVDNDGDSREASGGDGIVENQGVVGMEHVRAIHAESGGEVPDQTERETCGFSKRIHWHACRIGLRRKLTWMAGAIDRGLVAFCLLLAREVDGEALHSTYFEAR